MTDLQCLLWYTREECVCTCARVCAQVCVCVCSYMSGQNYRDVDHISVFPDLVQTPLLHPPLDTKETQ